MNRHTVTTGVLFASTALVGAAQAAGWERSFALDTFAPASYYAGKPGTTDDKAADCPHGVAPGRDIQAILTRTPWRTAEERKAMILAETQDLNDVAAVAGGGGGGGGDNPAAPPAVGARPAGEAQGPPQGGRPRPNNRTSLYYRGFAPDVNTVYNPMAAADAGMYEVVGKTAYGFDLDDNPATGGFVSPEGVPGIDNAYYRAIGCTYQNRGSKGVAYEVQFSNDHMRDGLQTIVMRVSGAKDPMNDDDVTVEIGYSPDKLVKDARSNVSPDYSFRLDPGSGRYSKFKAKIVDGQLVARDLTSLTMPEFAYAESIIVDPLVLQKARIQIKFNSNGTVEGMVGGYRRWPEYYAKDTWAQPLIDGPGRENFFHTDQIAQYYALERNADGLPDPVTGRMKGISAAYEFTAVPAVVLASDKPLGMQYPPMHPAARRDKNLFLKIAASGKIRRDSDPEVAIALLEGRNVGSASAPAPGGQRAADAQPANTAAPVAEASPAAKPIAAADIAPRNVATR
jgi:hypothetical protein